MRLKSKTALKISSTYMGMDVTDGITASYLNSNSWTISFWCYFSSGSNVPYLFNIGTGNTNFWMYYRPASSAASIRLGGGSDVAIPNASILSKWSHIVITYDNSTNSRKVYLDNSLHNSATYSLSVVASGGTLDGFSIGGDTSGISNFADVMFSQFTFHSKVLGASEISTLFNGVGYNDLTEQQKTDLSILSWQDFLNNVGSNAGKNHKGDSNYDFTPGNSSNISIVEGNFPKGISKTTGDRITQITSSDSSGLLLTADTSDLNYVPRYKATSSSNGKPAINFNQSTLSNVESYAATSTEQYLSANIDTLSGKEMTIFVVLREATNSGGANRTILASKGSTEADSKDLWLYVASGGVAYVYGNGSEQKAVGLSSIQYHIPALITYELNESNPKIHVNAATNTNSLTFSKQAFTALSIGARVYGSTVADKRNGDLAELIIYNKKLSSAQINTIKNYLNAKYQIY